MDVAGDCNIDKEHGTVAAALEQALAMLAAEERLGGASGGQNDIGVVGGFKQQLKGDSAAAKGLRQFHGALKGTVADDDVAGSMRDQVPRRQLRHLPCAHKVDRLALQRSKNLFRQLGRDRSDRDAGTTNGRF